MDPLHLADESAGRICYNCKRSEAMADCYFTINVILFAIKLFLQLCLVSNQLKGSVNIEALVYRPGYSHG